MAKYPNSSCKIEREAPYLTRLCSQRGLMVTLPKHQNHAEGLAALCGAVRLGQTQLSTSYVETCCLRKTCTERALCMAVVIRACGDLCAHPSVVVFGCGEPSPDGQQDLGFPGRSAPQTFSPPALFSDLAPASGKAMLETLLSAFPITELLLETWHHHSSPFDLFSTSVCLLHCWWEPPKLPYSEGFIGKSMAKMFVWSP